MNLEHKKVYTDLSELRYDILHDEWVIVARARGKRPDEFVRGNDVQEYDSEHDVFLDPAETGQEPNLLVYRDDAGEWTTCVFPNKYPVVTRHADLEDISDGPYPAVIARGAHEIVLTRDGRRTFALLEVIELAEVIDAYQERYIALMCDCDVHSITIFHNHGQRAGASVVHPHSQIIAIPVISSIVAHEIAVAQKYYKQNMENLFAVITAYEIEVDKRIVYENEHFIVYCPFAGNRAFGMRVMPKVPQPYFERITGTQKIALADALGTGLRCLYYGLDNPDFNYYIRTAPCNGPDYPEYSYYLEIFPRIHTYAGFEFATGTEIVPIAPEDAAQYLREFIDY